MLLTISRTFKEAWQNFYRNSWLTVATISVLILFLYVASLLYAVSFTAENILKGIQDKVNISIYFNGNVSEGRIMEIKGELVKNDMVKSVDYVSKEQAVINFKRDKGDNPEVMKSLEMLGDNPLPASLVVKANSSDQYDKLAEFINNSKFKPDIERLNYDKIKEIINNLNKSVASIKKVGVILVIIFALIAILITFNTIRITIYTHKPEIEVMRLVGASNSYIRLPFIFEGIMYGIFAAVISMILLFITLKFLNPSVVSTLTGNPKDASIFSQTLSFYIANIFTIFFLQAAFGIVLGVLSSLIAMRKYLKV